jgi:hypothetical protein
VATPNQLVASIVDHLKASPHPQSDVSSVVRQQVETLKTILTRQPSFGWAAENLEYAKKVRSVSQKLQRTLEGAPDGTRLTLFAFGAYASRSEMPHPEEIVAADTVERYANTLLTALHDLQNGCAKILDPSNRNEIGDYHTFDRTKHFCAAIGFELMVGLDAGQPTSGDPFRSITNNLYEIVAPKEAKARRQNHNDVPDLRTHCEKVLSNWRKDPDYLRQHVEIWKLAFAGMMAQKSASSM